VNIFDFLEDPSDKIIEGEGKMITEKEWQEFGKKLMASAKEDEKMSDADWEAILDSIPEGDIIEDDDDSDNTVAIAIKKY
jgi:hypothetical protein